MQNDNRSRSVDFSHKTQNPTRVILHMKKDDLRKILKSGYGSIVAVGIK